MGKISQHWHNIAEAGTATEGGGNRECRVREAGSSDPSVRPPPPPPLLQRNYSGCATSGTKMFSVS